MKLHLVEVRIDSGGYDSGGAYWGLGSPLWRAVSVDEHPIAWPSWVFPERRVDRVVLYLRSATRETAKADLLREYPNAKFFR